MKTSDKERKAQERERKRDRGLKPVQFWIHPKDEPAVRAYVERKNRKREDKS